MTIDLRTMRYFTAIAETGSISRAAAQVHVAQPALSVHVKAMESELGVELFERTAKGVVLTAAGSRFLTHCRSILEQVKAACDDVRGFTPEPIGRVSLGMPQSIGLGLTLPLVQEAARRWPRLHLQIMETSTGQVPGLLASHQIDLGILFFKEKNSGLTYTGLVNEELVLIGPPGQFAAFPKRRLERAEQQDFSRLATLPLFLPSPRQSLRQLIEWYATKAGVKLKTQADIDAVPQLISLVSESMGCSILSYPAVMRELEQGKISVARLRRPQVARTVYLCRSLHIPPNHAVQAVEKLISDMMGQLVAKNKWPGQEVPR